MGNPTLLTMPLCVNADKNTIPSTDAGTSGAFSEEYGWQNINSLPLASGGKAPNRRDFNGVFALLGGIAYACQRGYTFEWVATLPYLKGCVVTDPLDGNKYNAKNDVAQGGTHPSLDPTNWERFGDQYSLPTASASVKGGIKVGSGLSMSGDTLNNAYNYTLPTASESVKGGIKVGSGFSMSGDTLNNAYSLPTASATVKGGVKVGSGLSMSGDTLNNAYNYTLPTASATVKGGIKVGSGLSMNGETLNNAYSLPTASSSTLGGVKTGSNITNSSGTISLTKANVTNALGYTPPTTNTTYSTGTASTSGITKLYTGLGDNTDGTMTQKAIKAIFGKGYLTDSYYNATTGDWYRVYSDGWVEQGGIILASGSGNVSVQVTLLKAMADTKYSIESQRASGNTYSQYAISVGSETTTGFIFYWNQSNKAFWRVEGMGANS